MNEHQIKVPPVQPGTNPALKELEERIAAERGRISVLYRVLLNSEPIASGWEQLLTAVRNKTAVPADLRELMILRVAVLNHASFEFEAHIPHALRAGVSAEKIEWIKLGEIDQRFTATERLHLQLTDEMTQNLRVKDALMDALNAQYTPKEVVEIVATIATYNMVSRFLVALNIVH